MANMMDYLDWRGDLTFAQAPFNEVDNLLFSELAYVDFTGLVPADGGAVFLKDASAQFWERHTQKELRAHISMTKWAPFVMRKMAETKRFANVCLSLYVKDISRQEQSQFCAVCLTLDDGSLYVSYSGTDSTLIGWRENFNMVYLNQTPGQEKALRYLNAAVRGTHETVRVGGHSKGGNLAVYASVFCREDIRKKIVEIYNNDGPGFPKDMVRLPAYRGMLPGIRQVMPQQSMVGVLFEHGAQPHIVHSTESGPKQHDMLSWEVLGASMVYEKELSGKSLAFEETLSAWVGGMELPQRRRFIETVFSMLERAGLETVDDIYHLKWKAVSELLRSQRELTEGDRAVLSATWKQLIGAGNETVRRTLLEKKQ